MHIILALLETKCHFHSIKKSEQKYIFIINMLIFFRNHKRLIKNY
jgi:hypothetical protein